jgi:serine/threonine protein kinase
MASFAPDHSNIVAWPGSCTDHAFDGESLEAVMQTSPIARSRLLDIAVHVAEDLSTRHAAGAVHGHLTPRAIMLARNGGIKILSEDPFPAGSPQNDQLALGRILLSALQTTPENPDSLHHVIDRLLAADPQDRYSSTRDLYLDLRTIRNRLPKAPAPSQVSARQPQRVRRQFLAVPLALLAFTVVVFYLLNHAAIPKRAQAEIRSFPVWSPDGRRILFVKPVANIDQIFLDSFNSEPIQLTHASRPSVSPRWSADGGSIEFQRSGKWTSVRLP